MGQDGCWIAWLPPAGASAHSHEEGCSYARGEQECRLGWSDAVNCNGFELQSVSTEHVLPHSNCIPTALLQVHLLCAPTRNTWCYAWWLSSNGAPASRDWKRKVRSHVLTNV